MPVEAPQEEAIFARRGGNRKVIIGALIAVIIAGVGAVILFSRQTRSPGPPGPMTTPSITESAHSTTTVAAGVITTAPTTAAFDPQSVAMQLATLLVQSMSARNLVVAATQSVGACQETPAQGIQEIQEAISIRRDIVGNVDSLPVGALPAGPDMVRLLAQALQASLAADTDFIGWMNDIASQGCPVATVTDSSYQAAAVSSMQATTAKKQFLGLWNPVAQQYGLATFTEAQL